MNQNPATPSITLQPRKLFLSSSTEASKWNETAASENFGRAAVYAFAEFAWQKRAVDTNTAAMNALKVEGAKEFLEFLLSIGSTKEQRPPESLIKPLNPDPTFPYQKPVKPQPKTP
jgi:hypothetical protein